MLTTEEHIRYNRHLLLSEIGQSGQERLKQSRVLVIGAGGLGCPVLSYLVAAGVGSIGVLDYDSVDASNLHRQILYDYEDVGKLKAVVAKVKLQKQNPFIEIVAFPCRLETVNAFELISPYDIVIDGTDNFTARYIVNDACLILKKTLVSGSVYKFEGQVAVFDFKDEQSPSYRCLFPAPPSTSGWSCSEIGVIGVLPGIIGAWMASETIKTITGIGNSLANKVVIMNVLTMNFQIMQLEQNPSAIGATPKSREQFEKMNYDAFCHENKMEHKSGELTVDELNKLKGKHEFIQVIDIREPGEEPQVPELKTTYIPLSCLEHQTHLISREQKVIIVCQTGVRSKTAKHNLERNFGFTNLFTLQGGIVEWISVMNKIRHA